MSTQLSFRVDEKTRLRIARLARRKRLSKSEVMRQAIVAWVESQEAVASPYESMKDLIGVVHSGNPKRSEQTGREFKALLSHR